MCLEPPVLLAFLQFIALFGAPVLRRIFGSGYHSGITLVGGSLWPQGTAQTTHECRERIYLTERVKVPKGLKPPKIQKAQNRLQKNPEGPKI